MNEAARCDRISRIHAGRVLVSDSSAELVRQRGTQTLEQAFISHLEAASAGTAYPTADPPPASPRGPPSNSEARLASYLVEFLLW